VPATVAPASGSAEGRVRLPHRHLEAHSAQQRPRILRSPAQPFEGLARLRGLILAQLQVEQVVQPDAVAGARQKRVLGVLAAGKLAS